MSWLVYHYAQEHLIVGIDKENYGFLRTTS